MSQDPGLMTKHNVMAVPTVVIYHNGKEIKRFLPGLMLKLDVDVKEIQAVIDELVGDKF
jgi:thiol:disulfide interchange protein